MGKGQLETNKLTSHCKTNKNKSFAFVNTVGRRKRATAKLTIEFKNLVSKEINQSHKVGIRTGRKLKRVRNKIYSPMIIRYIKQKKNFIHRCLCLIDDKIEKRVHLPYIASFTRNQGLRRLINRAKDSRARQYNKEQYEKQKRYIRDE